MSEHCITLLGRQDEPTDAVEEYCQYLGRALVAHNLNVELVRVNWAELGWRKALKELRENAANWRGRWVLLQYTALGWSNRGVPMRLLRMVNLLRAAGVRLAVVYHDCDAYHGSRCIDRVRRSTQLFAMRRVLFAADFAVSTIPAEKLLWLPRNSPRPVFIPVGANLPPEQVTRAAELCTPPTITVFGITGGGEGQVEARKISDAVQLASRQLGALRLEVFGRHAELRERFLRESLRDVPVQVEVSGVLPAADVVGKLARSDVLLFLRGSISTRRGSAIAGIACGLPVIAHSGRETGPPITDAGVVLVPQDSREVAAALIRVLSDPVYRDRLAAQSRVAYQRYFSWRAIAGRYAEAMRSRA